MSWLPLAPNPASVALALVGLFLATRWTYTLEGWLACPFLGPP